MKLISRRTPHAVVGFTGSLVLLCAALLLAPPTARTWSLDKGGQYYFKINCPASDIDLVSFEYNGNETTYHFTGHCSQTSNASALPNFPYTIKGSWSKTSKTAYEVVNSVYGKYSKTGSCDYDPWLDPTVACQSAPAAISNNSEVMTHLRAKLDKDYYFPSSKGPFEDYRTGVLGKILNQSIKIVQPEEKKTYDFPGQITARVTTDSLVSPAGFPKNLMAILQIDEQPQWPDPNKPASSPRSFNLLGMVEHPGSGQPRAEFPIGTVDLWDGNWWVKAHLLVADPFWTPAVSFSVGPPQQLGPPPVQPSFPEVTTAEISSSAVEMNLPRRLIIMSPQAGQSVLSDMTLKIELWDYPEATGDSKPEIALDWTWSPFSTPGAFPPVPKTMDVRSKMKGTEVVIPRSAFEKNGIWSLTATFKVNENQTISDRVSFKIQDLSKVAGQMNLAPSVHATNESKAILQDGKQQIKPMQTKTEKATQSALKTPAKIEPQAEKLQNQPATIAMSALKSAPTILRPSENERFDRPGSIPISARVSVAEASLLWEIEYQAFGASSFVRQPPPAAGSLAAGGGTVKMARLNFMAPGTYRFRLKEDGDKARWSGWRTVVVGSPPAVVPAAKNLQLKSKSALPTDAVKKVPEQKQQAEPETPQLAPASTQKKPIIVKPIKIPKAVQ